MALGLFVVWHNPRGRANRLYGLTCLALAIWNVGMFMMYYVPHTQEGWRQASIWNNCLHLGLLFIAPLSYHFALAVTGATRREAYWLAYLGYVLSAFFMYYSVMGTFIHELRWIEWNPERGAGGWVPSGSRVSRFFDMVFAVYMALTVGVLVRRYRTASDAVERNRLRYLIIAIVLALAGGIPNFLMVRGMRVYPIGHVMQIPYALLIAYTILRYRLMDIGVVIRRAVLYTTATMGLLGIYVLLLLGLIRGVRTGLVGPVPFWLTATMAFGLAFVFQPLDRALRAWVNRRFFKEEYEAQRALRDLSGSVVSFLEQEELLDYTLRTLRRALGVEYCAVYLPEEGRLIPRASEGGSERGRALSADGPLVSAVTRTGEPLVRDEIGAMLRALNLDREGTDVLEQARARLRELGVQVAVPLPGKENLGGLLLVGEKTSGELFSPSDLALLATLGNQLAVAVENARLYERLRQAYQDLEDAQRQLYQSEKLAAIGELAAGVAHEINNPLGAILVTAQRMKRALRGEEKTSDWMGAIEDGVMRCKDIVRGLLDFARQNVAQMVRTDIHEVLDKTIALARTHRALRRSKIVTEYATRVPTIVADPNQLVQVFLNLFVNGGLSMEDGGTLTVRTQAADGWVRVEVQDTGSGIAREMLDKIFHPFVSTRGEAGTGLGLSVSYGIVERHRGRIWAESETGKGSTFFVELPVEQPQASAVEVRQR